MGKELNLKNSGLALTKRDIRGLLGHRMQLAYVVKDIDEATTYWTEVLGMGPFIVLEECRDGRPLKYRGCDTPVEWSLAFTYHEGVQIELICQTNVAPSAFQAFLDAGQEGLHHIGYWPQDFDFARAVLEENGHELVSAVYQPDGVCIGAYYAAPAHVGVMIELAPWTPFRASYFDAIRDLCENWDGRDRPVRKYRNRAAFLAELECSHTDTQGKEK